MAATLERTAAPAAKVFATLQAFAAMHGITVVQSTNDRDEPVYVANRWAFTKQFETLAALHDWLEQVTGRRA